ncbi:unnamed protein product, partial [marine sediment metagenome]
MAFGCVKHFLKMDQTIPDPGDAANDGPGFPFGGPTILDSATGNYIMFGDGVQDNASAINLPPNTVRILSGGGAGYQCDETGNDGSWDYNKIINWLGHWDLPSVTKKDFAIVLSGRSRLGTIAEGDAEDFPRNPSGQPDPNDDGYSGGNITFDMACHTTLEADGTGVFKPGIASGGYTYQELPQGGGTINHTGKTKGVCQIQTRRLDTDYLCITVVS